MTGERIVRTESKSASVGACVLIMIDTGVRNPRHSASNDVTRSFQLLQHLTAPGLRLAESALAYRE
jgi:hypothetical protein